MNDTSSFRIDIDRDRILLHGDLDGSPEMLLACGQAMRHLKPFGQLTIEASEAMISPRGVTAWIQAVEQFLMGCEIVYTPSQLGVILQYDERYPHLSSSFQEYPAMRPARRELTATAEHSFA